MLGTGWEKLGHAFSELLDLGQLVYLTVLLCVAALLGGIVGFQREKTGKAAGLRTHMLVAVGAALFVLVPAGEGMQTTDLSRVVQGIVTGVGFLGAGVILKLTEKREIRGLTTAASLWLVAAIGMAIGFGRPGTALIGTIIAFVILDVFNRFETSALNEEDDKPQNPV